MKLFIQNFCLMLIPLISFSQNDYNQIISENFQASDSLNIKMVYTDFVSDNDNSKGVIFIKKIDEKFEFHHYPPNNKIPKHLRKINNNIMNLISNFEYNAKLNADKAVCGKVSEKPEIQVQLFINNQKTEFSYCKNSYNGLEELIYTISENKPTNFLTKI